MKEIRIGLIGVGTVGGGVVKILSQRLDEIRADQGLPITLARIVDKNISRFTALPVGNATCTTETKDIIGDDSIRIVVELVGGVTFARTLILDALGAGKHVVTANKALIAEHGPELFECAEKNGVSLYFEASVGGGMPVIKMIREGLIGNSIYSIKTIINGTSNYILSTMTAEGLSFDAALKQAQEKGYAEADPALDVGGRDAGHKVSIMASLISGGYVPLDAISIEGVTGIKSEDITVARELGYTIKLLGVIKKGDKNAALDVRVHPAMLHSTHILASVSDAYNAVLLEGDAVGQILLYGKGAGEMPTASAVVSDIVDVARNIQASSSIRIPMGFYSMRRAIPVVPISTVVSRYYLRFTVDDKPGVLASIAGFLGNQNISISSVMQKESHSDGVVPVIILTHEAMEQGVRTALQGIERMEYIKGATRVIRIED
jgi:homoserine dehydrogenase